MPKSSTARRKRVSPSDAPAPIFRPRLAYRFDEFEALVGAEPGAAAAEVAAGRLKAVKVGNTAVIPVGEALQFLDGDAKHAV